jgi:hypothetical protein
VLKPPALDAVLSTRHGVSSDMNGPIAQLVAITCFGNAFLRRGEIPRFFPDNSTCRFCDRINFVEIKTPLIGKQRESAIADSPDEWFSYLKQREAHGIRLLHERQNLPGISDRMSAGFVGGGGIWALGVRFRRGTEYWMARWEVCDQNDPDRPVWKVTYGRVGRQIGTVPSLIESTAVRSDLISALLQIRAFAEKHDCKDFTEFFSRALDSLNENSSKHGYHNDLWIAGTLSESSCAIIDAAQSAWVFGGMGSWNDMIFSGDDEMEYERVSDQLFSALTGAICFAANETYEWSAN